MLAVIPIALQLVAVPDYMEALLFCLSLHQPMEDTIFIKKVKPFRQTRP